MTDRQTISASRVADETDVSEDDVLETLRWLCAKGWLFSNHVEEFR